MTVSAYPLLVDALVAQMGPLLEPLDAVAADVVPTADAPSDFLGVGLPSISETGPINTGASRQKAATVGAQGARDEEGFVRCLALAYTRDETVKGARDRAAAIFEAVATLTRGADPSLGVDQLLWTSIGTETDWGLIFEEGQPTGAWVEFVVAFRARI